MTEFKMELVYDECVKEEKGEFCVRSRSHKIIKLGKQDIRQ